MKQTTKGGLHPRRKIRKKKQILLNGWTTFSIQIGPRKSHLRKKCYWSLSFLLVFFSFLLYILVLVSCPPPPFFFFGNLIFLIYFTFSHISTIHPYLTYFLSWHLFLSISEESGGKNLLSCDLYYSSHFLINAADKTIVHHLMQR